MHAPLTEERLKGAWNEVKTIFIKSCRRCGCRANQRSWWLMAELMNWKWFGSWRRGNRVINLLQYATPHHDAVSPAQNKLVNVAEQLIFVRSKYHRLIARIWPSTRRRSTFHNCALVSDCDGHHLASAGSTCILLPQPLLSSHIFVFFFSLSLPEYL